MTLFLTGAAGFIGSNTAEELIKEHTVVGLDNFDPFYSREIKEQNLSVLRKSDSFTFYEGDLNDEILIKNIFSDHSIDCIIHLAAKAGVRPSIENPGGYVEANINGTVTLLEAAKKAGVRHIVFASSSSVYGNCDTVPFREDADVDTPVSPYAATKKSCELICHTYAHLYGMRFALLRFFTVYGRRQRPDLAIAKFTKLIHNGDPVPFYGDGNTERDYTYIDDIIDGIMKSVRWCMKQSPGAYDIFNIGEQDTTSLKDLVSKIEKALGKKARIDRQPLQPGDVMRTNADITKARRVLGYNPRTKIDDGIREYVQYFLGSQFED